MKNCTTTAPGHKCPSKSYSPDGTKWKPTLDKYGNQLRESKYLPFGWTGMYKDRFTGLYHTQFREYDPLHERWLTIDPAGYNDGLNLYHAYMGVNGVDVLGLEITFTEKVTYNSNLRDITKGIKQGMVKEFFKAQLEAIKTWVEAMKSGKISLNSKKMAHIITLLDKSNVIINIELTTDASARADMDDIQFNRDGKSPIKIRISPWIHSLENKFKGERLRLLLHELMHTINSIGAYEKKTGKLNLLKDESFAKFFNLINNGGTDDKVDKMGSSDYYIKSLKTVNPNFKWRLHNKIDLLTGRKEQMPFGDYLSYFLLGFDPSLFPWPHKSYEPDALIKKYEKDNNISIIKWK